ncbi:MAG: biopolymer transporter ExbD [Rhabdochlamydiaceae bacterium]|nr:biopolymer transporter ExbD [Rhabdochlamydiaceae bacterium]
MRRSSRSSHVLPEAEINLTPLLDVVFVVLIIFIIIAPMLEIDRIELANAAPTKQSTTSPQSSSIAIHVREDNSIWFENRKVNAQELTRILEQIRHTGNQRIPQLFQDKRAAFGTYQTVKNAVEVAGYEQMDVILKPN